MSAVQKTDVIPVEGGGFVIPAHVVSALPIQGDIHGPAWITTTDGKTRRTDLSVHDVLARALEVRR
jgi:hypothetical protein